MKSILSILFVALISAMVAPSAALQQTDIQGVWYNEPKDAKIEIYEKSGKIYGKVVWMKDEIDPDTGKPQLDEKNPDDDLKSRPVMGLEIMTNFEYKGDLKWEDGRVYDPEKGKTYGGTITLLDKNTLKLRGYIVGMKFLGRSEEWTRAN